MTNHIRFWYCKGCNQTLPRKAFSAKYLDANTRCTACQQGQSTATLMDAQEGTAQPVYVRRNITRRHSTDNRD